MLSLCNLYWQRCGSIDVPPLSATRSAMVKSGRLMVCWPGLATSPIAFARNCIFLFRETDTSALLNFSVNFLCMLWSKKINDYFNFLFVLCCLIALA